MMPQLMDFQPDLALGLPGGAVHRVDSLG